MVLQLADFCNVTLPDVPLKPVLALHWLAVNGTQPSIPENPSLVQSDIDNQPVNLAKELQVMYIKVMLSIVITLSSMPIVLICTYYWYITEC